MMAERPHLFPFRTQKLSSSAPMVLGVQTPGRVGRSQVRYSEVAQWRSNRLLTGRLWVRVPPSEPVSGLIAQLGEHLPYKQGVTGSSPVGPTKFNMAIIEKRIHLFPSRTQQLSSSSPMVLGPQGPGRVGRSQLTNHRLCSVVF